MNSDPYAHDPFDVPPFADDRDSEDDSDDDQDPSSSLLNGDPSFTSAHLGAFPEPPQPGSASYLHHSRNSNPRQPDLSFHIHQDHDDAPPFAPLDPRDQVLVEPLALDRSQPPHVHFDMSAADAAIRRFVQPLAINIGQMGPGHMGPGQMTYGGPAIPDRFMVSSPATSVSIRSPAADDVADPNNDEGSDDVDSDDGEAPESIRFEMTPLHPNSGVGGGGSGSGGARAAPGLGRSRNRPLHPRRTLFGGAQPRRVGTGFGLGAAAHSIGNLANSVRGSISLLGGGADPTAEAFLTLLDVDNLDSFLESVKVDMDWVGTDWDRKGKART
ncbi:hypothetical protein BDK51DRAFT_43789 [Blyttiomyces helicus]|uniref:Uncharacterized protein n=1 Tax=Blyttiomyces helicus TaxID=388810 RepID=A0A4P9WAD5_9FUNG|nr:hypothetical protein BDK51DRAFT_43789 [Blyttiomyces helicus]|eukprot:RKO89551.1 hypothetical protein BDK51DRAFT_43789 [Blyttiomyces helicus]